jgi:hypothetical protein
MFSITPDEQPMERPALKRGGYEKTRKNVEWLSRVKILRAIPRETL